MLTFINGRHSGNKSPSDNFSNFFIHLQSCDDGYDLKVLSQTEAFTKNINSKSDCIKKWAGQLQLSAVQYLNNFEAAIRTISQQNDATEQSSSNDGKPPEHILAISDGVLSWKQYFPNNKVHGKKGSIPMDKAERSEITWSILQSAASKQISSAKNLEQLQQQNKCLEKECGEAKKVAQKSVELKQQFQQQTYAKFCHLINTKKLYIRQLLEDKKAGDAAVSAPGASRATTARTAALLSDGGDEFDGDTDVDDVDCCDTDEEQQDVPTARKAKNETNTNKKLIVFADGESSMKRKVLNSELGQASKKQSLMDFRDDSFNDSFETENRASLLNCIQPRQTKKE